MGCSVYVEAIVVLTGATVKHEEKTTVMCRLHDNTRIGDLVLIRDYNKNIYSMIRVNGLRGHSFAPIFP
jgi:hypothetical protein